MTASTPEQKTLLFAEAMNAANLETMLEFYTDEATFVGPDGTEARGKTEIRSALVNFLALRPKMTIAVRFSHRAGDTAMVSAGWQIEGIAPDGTPMKLEGTNFEVQRWSQDKGWQCVIDKPDAVVR